MQLGALGSKHGGASATAEPERAGTGFEEGREGGERGGDGEGGDVVEECQRGGRSRRRGEGGDHGAEEGRGEHARRRGEEEGEG